MPCLGIGVGMGPKLSQSIQGLESNFKKEKISFLIFQKMYILPKYIPHPFIFISEVLENMLMFNIGCSILNESLHIDDIDKR